MKKRLLISVVAAALVAVAMPSLRADVKTVEKRQFKLAGALGAFINHFSGQADGVTDTVAVKGNRKSQIDNARGEIIDLGEEKVYTLDVKKKEYTVKTFAQLRADYEKERADAQKNVANMKPEEKQDAQPAQDNGKQMQFDVDVKETGQHKTLAGRDAREVVLTITGHEKDKTLEDSGGFVMTNDMWLGPRIAALDEIRDFDLKYFRAVYGESAVADMQQMAQVAAMYAAFQPMMGRMSTEGGKLQGTSLASTTTFDSVKSAAQMKDAAQSSPQQDQSSGGGLGGMLGRRIMGNRGSQAPQARTTVMTATVEYQSIDTSVSDADVQIPAGFKEKK